MKKLIVILLVVVSLVSCKDELPSNISYAVSSRQMWLSSLDNIDSLIISLSDEDIKKLSKDSSLSLFSSHTFYQEHYDKSDEELDELLKFNPEYSDHEDIKNKKYHFTIENRLKVEDGIDKLRNNINKLQNN